MVFQEDESGFFYIYLDDARRNIVVEHYEGVEREVRGHRRTATGKINKVFKGSNAETIYRTILGNGLISRIDHAAYVGYELAKAEIALKNGLKYEQDRPVKV
ncbi:MAG: DUF4346 domain-containing protein [Candidatus Altiarchaeota archaeon]|nr:DUF4346 domain-containing protein [Candidatus Altiarchaeota archaeon]